jgi:serine/threonine protein kinase/Flp pilus assembly protein TadD
LDELLPLDIEYRRRRGETPLLEEYQRRFPNHGESVRAVFQKLPAPVSTLASQDRNLLLGIVALQMNFISQDALIKAMTAWALNKTRSLGEILHENGHLSGNKLQKLEELVPGDTTQVRYAKKTEDSGIPGGLGIVFKAHDRELQREVALKEIREEFCGDPDSRSRFLFEGEVTAKLQHPGIVPIYGMGRYDDGRPYYAMRFVEGENLKEAIEHFHQADRKPDRKPGERTLSLRQLLGRFVAVCNAVAYAHNRGVIHRDLKPANILLGKYGETLVVDWGLAKLVGRPESSKGLDEKSLHLRGDYEVATRPGSRMGTVPYMSPEQACGSLEELGPASDIYSLGATLYELLTGSVPIKGKDRAEKFAKIKKGEWLPPRQVKLETPGALDAICCKAMALAPKDRYETALHLAAEIERWMADEPVQAYCEPFRRKAERWMQRHRTGITTSIASMLLIAHREAEEQRHKAVPQPDTTRGYSPRFPDGRRDYYAGLSERKQWQDHVFKPQRKRLLVMGLEFYQQFLQEERDELNVQAELGRPSKRLADLYQDECGRAYLRLANIYCAFGSAIWPKMEQDDADSAQRGYEKAERAYQEALAIFRHLVQNWPHLPDYRKNLASTFNNLGVLYSETGCTAKAEAAYLDALEMQRNLADTYPAVAEYHKDLAGCYNNLSILYSHSGCNDKAEIVYQEMVAIQKKLADAYPEVVEFAIDLGACYGNLGQLVNVNGRLREARKYFEDALQTLRQALDKDPQNGQARQALFMAQCGQAEILSRLGHHAEAIQNWDQAGEVADGRHQPELRLSRARALARAGDHTQATTAAAELNKTSFCAGWFYHEMACVYSLASATARKDTGLSPRVRARLAELYASRAVKLLHKAFRKDRSTGTMSSPRLSKKDLEPLRARRDFKALMAKIGKKGKVVRL